MAFVSYAQNFEDVILNRALEGVENGFYVDVGANDPVHDSVTKAFYDRGWRGINIEPVSACFDRLCAARPRDVNLKVLAGSEAGEGVLYELPDSGLSTTVTAIATQHERERGTPARRVERAIATLTDICAEQTVGEIHFLKIDVEGAEQEVLLGIDLSRFRPWIVVVESTLPNSQIEDHQRWEELLLERDYAFVLFDGLNRFYLAAEHADLAGHFALPPNFFDGFELAADVSFCAPVVHELRAETAELKHQLQLHHAAMKSVTERIDGLARKLDETEAMKVEFEAQLRTERDAGAKLQAKIGELEAQKSELEAQKSELASRSAELQSRQQQLELEVDDSRKQLDESRKQLDGSTRQLDALQLENAKLRARVDDLALQHAAARDNLESTLAESLRSKGALEQQLRDVHASTSWRVTAPMRAVKSAIDQLREATGRRDQQSQGAVVEGTAAAVEPVIDDPADAARAGEDLLDRIPLTPRAREILGVLEAGTAEDEERGNADRA